MESKLDKVRSDMEFIDEVFAVLKVEYVVTLHLSRVYVYDHSRDLKRMKEVARNLASAYGRNRVRLRLVSFEDDEAYASFIETAEVHREQLDDYESDHGIADESGSYF